MIKSFKNLRKHAKNSDFVHILKECRKNRVALFKVMFDKTHLENRIFFFKK